MLRDVLGPLVRRFGPSTKYYEVVVAQGAGRNASLTFCFAQTIQLLFAPLRNSTGAVENADVDRALRVGRTPPFRNQLAIKFVVDPKRSIR